MSTLDELQQDWGKGFQPAETYTEVSLQKLIQARVRKHTRTSMQYFWASFALQILVYALLSHVIIRYWNQTQLVVFSMIGILFYVPFTIVLMRKFKRMAISTCANADSVHAYVRQQKEQLESFFTFKRRYEWILIPVSAAIGVFLVFALYVPGGVEAFPMGAGITYVLTLLSCYLAIHSENQKSFIRPLDELETLLNEYRETE